MCEKEGYRLLLPGWAFRGEQREGRGGLVPARWLLLPPPPLLFTLCAALAGLSQFAWDNLVDKLMCVIVNHWHFLHIISHTCREKVSWFCFDSRVDCNNDRTELCTTNVS